MSKEQKKDNKTKAKPKKTVSKSKSTTKTKMQTTKLKSTKVHTHIPEKIQNRKIIDFDKLNPDEDDDDVTQAMMSRQNASNFWDIDYHRVDPFSTDADDDEVSAIENLDASDAIDNVIEAYAGLLPEDNPSY